MPGPRAIALMLVVGSSRSSCRAWPTTARSGGSIHVRGGSWADATSWPPSGDELAFSVSGGEQPGIYAMRPDGRGLHLVTPL